MIGNSFIADTNFLINVHEGKEFTMPFLDKFPIISVISEIELLGWPKLKTSDITKLNALLADCVILELTPEIKRIAIEIRQQYFIKTPDAIIADTARFMELPLVTSDKGFEKIKTIEVVLI